MKMFRYTFFIVLGCLFVSCAKWGNSENSRLMQQAQGLVEHAPDSALILLDSVNTALLSRKGTAEFTLLRVQARTNADRDLTNDNEIFRAWEYFAEKKDAEKAALAGFYAAWVAKAQKDPALEMDCHLKTLPFAEKANNQLLQGKIYNNMGFLNYSQQLYADAVTNYRKALKYYKAAGNQYRREIFTMNDMANAFLIEKQTDSAQFYYRKSLELAQWHDDTSKQVIIYTNMGYAGKKMEQLDTAIFYYRKSSRLAKDENEKAYIYKNLADLFHEKKELDSAGYYISRAEPLYQKLDNRYAMASLNFSYYQIEKSGGNYRKALEYLEVYAQYQDELNDSRDRQLLLDIQKKYDTALLENEFNRKKSRWWKFIALLGCSVLALAAVVLYTKNENKKKKLALERTEKEKMEKQMALEKLERENAAVLEKIEALQNMYLSRDNDIKTVMLEKLGFYKEMAIFNLKFEGWKKELPLRHASDIGRIISKFDLDKIVDAANESFPVLVEHLKSAKLKDNEVEACCLIVCGFNNNEIAGLMNKSVETIEKWKTNIRNKLDVEQRGDIYKHLMEKISIPTPECNAGKP